MCDIYAETDPELYEPLTRSVRLHGAVTSIRLERQFWSLIDTIAASEGMSTPRFVTTLYDEVLERRGEVENFASLLRVICTAYAERKQTAEMVAAQ